MFATKKFEEADKLAKEHGGEVCIVPKSALKAGTQTASLINHLYSGSISPIPTVGMGATILSWTDRHAATIVEVVSHRKIAIIEDNAEAKHKGMTDSQEWELTPGTGGKQYFTLRVNGTWVREGESIKGQRLGVGYKSHYYDYSF